MTISLVLLAISIVALLFALYTSSHLKHRHTINPVAH